MMDKLKYLKEVVEKEKNNFFEKNENDKEKVYKSNELINIINNKYEIEKINQALYVGEKLRNITVTNLIQCPRLITYNRLGYKPNIDKAKMYPYIYLISNVENYIHEKLVKLLSITDINNMFFQHKEYPICGKVDGIFYNSLIEFKLIPHEEFLILKQPKEKDIIQTRILYDICKYSNNYNNIDMIKILYISTNLKDIVEFNIFIDDIKNRSIIEEYYKIGLHIYDCLKKEILSDKYLNSDCYLCLYNNYCKYYNSYNKNKENIKKENDIKLDKDDEIINEFFNSNDEKLEKNNNIQKKDNNDIVWF